MMTTCNHPLAFFANSLDGCRVREAGRDEVVAWVVGQKHPRFSLAAPNSLCFDRNVRVNDVIVAREKACECVIHQPWMD